MIIRVLFLVLNYRSIFLDRLEKFFLEKYYLLLRVLGKNFNFLLLLKNVKQGKLLFQNVSFGWRQKSFLNLLNIKRYSVLIVEK